MPNKYAVLSLFVGVIFLLSWSANPPDGRSGAPGDGLCSDCHSLNGGTQDGEITVSGFPTTIEPNTAYVLTVTNSNPNGVAELAGFQLTILNGNNQQAGTITSPSSGSTVSTSGGRQYWEHNPAQTYPMSNVVMWTATWTAPNTPPNTTITYYVAGNIANGNGSSTGDRIDNTSGSGMLNGGGSNLDVNITSYQDVLCYDQNTGSATATATGGVPPYSYSWSNGGSGSTINNLGAGTYTVTATDNASTTATASVIISEPDELDFNTPNINHVDCFGGNDGSISVTAMGGVSPYSYSWSTGASGNSISNLTAGPYTVTVTDDNNCTSSATFTVTQPNMITITASNLDHESCAGEEDGTITIQVSGGVSPYFAEWSNSAIGFTISNLEPGTYSVTVTDNNDCTKSATYTINPGGTIEVSLNSIQHVTCNGGANGAISVSATGGVAPYLYEWSNGQTGSSITGLAAGTYLVTVSDAQGCAVVEGYTINQPTAINIMISQSGQNLCFGDTAVDLSATITGGTPGYSAIWSDGTSGMTNNNVGAGSYTITVTDNNSCTKTASIVVTEPPQLIVNVVTTDETTSGGNDGTATANAGGGTPGYTYLWSNGATTQSINSLSPGVYSVTISDVNGCTTVASGQVNAFGCAINLLLGSDLTLCQGDTFLIFPVITGATGNLSYLWNDGSTSSSLQVSAGGEYCLTVTDEANCAASDCILINENIISLTCPVTDESAPGANDGAINCDGNTSIVTYSWSNGATTSSIIGLSPGEYCVTVTDNAGCTGTQCFIVQSANCLMVVDASIEHVACNGEAGGSISLVVTNAAEPITYAWSNGATTSSITNIPAGTYSVSVTDAEGCAESKTYVVNEPPVLTIIVDSIQHINPPAPGAVMVTVQGGTEPYTFVWTFPDGSTANTSLDLSGLTLAGIYNLSLTDANGCALSIDVMVEFEVSVGDPLGPGLLKIYPSPAQDFVFIEMDKKVAEVLIYGMDGRLHRRITDPADNQLNVTNLEAGIYLLRISDGREWYFARLMK